MGRAQDSDHFGNFDSLLNSFSKFVNFLKV